MGVIFFSNANLLRMGRPHVCNLGFDQYSECLPKFIAYCEIITYRVISFSGTDLCKNASFEPNDLLKFIKVSKEKLARLKKVEQTNDALDSIWKALEKYEADILKKTRSSGTPS